MPYLKRSNNERGFAKFEFTDTYGLPCSLQKSSSAEEDKIWLGPDDAKPQIMASVAHRMGLDHLLQPEGTPERLNGWVPYPIPKDVLLSTRMHLNQEQVRELLPALIHFAETGELP